MFSLLLHIKLALHTLFSFTENTTTFNFIFKTLFFFYLTFHGFLKHPYNDLILYFILL